MAAYDPILELIKEYFLGLGYRFDYLNEYFSGRVFRELISIRLANANVTIKNKSDKKSHQTHIAITGEAISFFYNQEEMKNRDNKQVDKRKVCISIDNINNLLGKDVIIEDSADLNLEDGFVTVGTRTQKQVQLSKKNLENSNLFNSLRLGLYENDLLILLKYRYKDMFLAIGIPQIFYLDYIPNYVNKYETNTYLVLPKINI